MSAFRDDCDHLPVLDSILWCAHGIYKSSDGVGMEVDGSSRKVGSVKYSDLKLLFNLAVSSS